MFERNKEGSSGLYSPGKRHTGAASRVRGLYTNDFADADPVYIKAAMYLAAIPGIVLHIVAFAGVFDAQSGVG